MLVCKHAVFYTYSVEQGGYMRENMVRLSFDIPEDEHFILKNACVQAKVSIKDYVHGMLLKGLEDLKKDAFKKRLKESIKQSKKEKGRIISSTELDEMVGNGG